ncbi:hypothetical protein SUGI_1148150 [Cryptomeria japonica]|nr:hypothetical protein SUGI_1148150 [Cryptomeria japonica]
MDFLLSWLVNRSSSKWEDLWIISPSMLVWHIWRERNQRIFREEEFSLGVVINNLKAGIEEVVNVRSKYKKYRYFSTLDKAMEEEWNLEEVVGFISPCKKVDKKDVVWKPPPTGWVKLNFDGASKGNLGRARFGALIRNDCGRIICSVAGPYGTTSNNEVELKGLEEGLAMCVEKGMEKVIIEGDSQMILNGISKGHFPNWRIQMWTHRIEQLLSSLVDYRMQHTYREGNRAAYWLANNGFEANLDQTIDNSIDWDQFLWIFFLRMQRLQSRKELHNQVCIEIPFKESKIDNILAFVVVMVPKGFVGIRSR